MADASPKPEGTLFLTQLLYQLRRVEREVVSPPQADVAMRQLVRVWLIEAIDAEIERVMQGGSRDDSFVPELFRIAGDVYPRELNWALERAIKLE